MKLGLAISSLLFCFAACGPETSQTEIVDTSENVVKAAQKSVADLEERLARALATCENGPSRYDPSGKLALAEVDVAMAENIVEVTPEQEQRIRTLIGAEMGLAPSQVDGWREIYESRGAAARALLKQAEREEDLQQQRACDYLPELRTLLSDAETDLASLQN